MENSGFLTDFKTLRNRTRRHIEEGAVTEGCHADRGTVLMLLNEALATELVRNLRYRRHFFMAQGIDSDSIRTEFREHAEMAREDLVAERIAIDSYREMIRFLGEMDPTARRMLEGILAVEEEHAEDLATWLRDAP